MEDPIGEAEKVFGEKWDSMLYYLKADMQDINTIPVFPCLKLVITQIGIEGIPGILEPWSMIQRSFSLYSYGISRGECEICRPLLERGVHQELFMWIEEHSVFNRCWKLHQLFEEHPVKRQYRTLDGTKGSYADGKRNPSLSGGQ